jgi:hypothetical protein
VHVRAAGPVGFGPAQDLAGDRRDLARAPQDEAQEVDQRAALGPVEVDVRDEPNSSRMARQIAAMLLGTAVLLTVSTW